MPFSTADAPVTTLSRMAPALELVTSPGSLGATASASFLLAATTTALPTWARWLGEKISFSFPVVDAWTARSASRSTYWSVGRASSFL